MLFGDQNSSNIKFEVIFASVVLAIEIVWGSVGNEKNGSKHNLSFSVKMNPVHRRVGLLRQALIKIDVIILVEVVLVSEPDCFINIDLFPIVFCLLYFLWFFAVFCFLSYLNIIIRLFFFFFNWGIDFNFVLFEKVDGEIDEL